MNGIKSVQNIYFIFKRQTSMRHITDYLLASAWKGHIANYTNVFLCMHCWNKQTCHRRQRKKLACLRELTLSTLKDVPSWFHTQQCIRNNRSGFWLLQDIQSQPWRLYVIFLPWIAHYFPRNCLHLLLLILTSLGGREILQQMRRKTWSRKSEVICKHEASLLDKV